MKAKLLKEQMGVPAGTEMEVVETGRAWTLKAPSGAEIVVPSCDLEMVPDTEPNSEPKPNPVDPDPEFDPETDPAVRDADGNVVMNDPEPTEEEKSGKFSESVFPSDEVSSLAEGSGGTDDPPEGTDDEDAVGSDDATGEEE